MRSRTRIAMAVALLAVAVGGLAAARAVATPPSAVSHMQVQAENPRNG
jgi:uncharacterized protein involved in exopolysaccharide biosynthesis